MKRNLEGKDIILKHNRWQNRTTMEGITKSVPSIMTLMSVGKSRDSPNTTIEGDLI